VEAAAWRIYPNPSNKMVYLEPLNSMGAVHIRMIDLSGRTVVEHRFAQSDAKIPVDVSALKSGMYVLQINGNTHYKVQVQH
ncbi:MAG: Secretion system C-terminal sorting domain, partial [Bacteroidota bacterium]